MSSERSIYHRFPFYYGWLIFLETLLIYVFMYGLRYSVGVFFVPLQEEFGWTSTMTSGAVTVFFFVYGLTGLFVGRLSVTIGVRKALFVGGLLLGVGGILSSFTSALWHLYFSWGVVAAMGSSILYTIPNMILSRFFSRHRGKAVGWSSIGISIGQAVLVPFSASVIEFSGWRTAYILLSTFVLLGISCLGYLVFRESPESIGLKIDGGELTTSDQEPKVEETLEADWLMSDAFQTRTFKLLLVSYFFQVGSIISLLTFVVPHVRRLGVDPLVASTVFSVIGLMSAIGSFIFGVVSDKIGRKSTIIVTAIGLTISMFVSLFIPPNIFSLYVWVTLYGLTYGGIPEQYAAIVADYFKSKQDISLFGYLMFVGALGGSLFPLVGGYLADLTGDYYASLTFLGIGMFCALLTVLPIKPPKKRQISV